MIFVGEGFHPLPFFILKTPYKKQPPVQRLFVFLIKAVENASNTRHYEYYDGDAVSSTSRSKRSNNAVVGHFGRRYSLGFMVGNKITSRML
jgi:hypothetical protein